MSTRSSSLLLVLVGMSGVCLPRLAAAAAPSVRGAHVVTPEDTATMVVLDARDADGDALVWSIPMPPAVGSASIAPGLGYVFYRPAPDWNGELSLQVAASDGTNTRYATVVIEVTPVNDPPVGSSITVDADEDVPVDIPLPGEDRDADPLSFRLVAPPAIGEVSIDPATGAARFTPPADWSGETWFRYAVDDGAATSGGRITVVVRPQNDAPVAADLHSRAREDGGPVWIPLRPTDPDPGADLGCTLTAPPRHGSVVLAGCVAVYTPAPGQAGSDAFSYVADDGWVSSAPATARVDVVPVDDAPRPYPVAAFSDGGPIDILPAWEDPDGGPVDVTIAVPPARGAVRWDGARFTYTPEPGFVGRDRFAWSAGGEEAWMVVSVAPPSAFVDAGWSQLGVSGVGEGAEPTLAPDDLLGDIALLGAGVVRGLGASGVGWATFNPTEGEFLADGADALIDGARCEPRMQLFAEEWASPTPPWANGADEFQESVGGEAVTYLDEVLGRYHDRVHTWELGDAMWRWTEVADPEALGLSSWPADEFSTEEHAWFLAEAGAFVRAWAPDARVVLPSIDPSEPASLTWLDTLVALTGDDWFDTVSYEAFGDWEESRAARAALETHLAELGLEDKLVELTATGTSVATAGDPDEGARAQAADVARRALSAWAAGDAAVLWERWRDTADDRGRGLLDHSGAERPAAATFALLADELLPFLQVTDLSDPAAGRFHLRVTRVDGAVREVAWGEGSMTVPAGATEAVRVVRDDDSPGWVPVRPGDVLPLDGLPWLVR